MANLRIMFPNEADSAVLTVTPDSVTNLPVTNLQIKKRGYIWRSMDLTAQAIFGNWADSAPRTLGGAVLHRHNLTAAATARLRVWDAQNQTGTLLYDSGVTALGTTYGWGSFAWGMVPWGGATIFDSWSYRASTFWFPANLTTARSFRWDITDVGNAWGFMEASRIYMGAVFEPTINMDRPNEIGWDESTEQFRTAGGSLLSDQTRTPFRRWNVKWGHLSEADRETLFEITRRAGKRMDLYISGFPGEGGAKERDYAGLVKFINIPTLTNLQVDASEYEAPLTVEET